MGRIVRAEPGWEDEVRRALARAHRPIPLDQRLLPRTARGEVLRASYDRATLPAARRAATLVAIYPDRSGRLVVPLTVRREDLRAHAGEVSLPGGSMEEADVDLETTALREAWEEIALEPKSVTLAGRLDLVWIPVSNYEVVPVVGTVAQPPNLIPQDAEVAAIVELPLEALHDDEVLAVEEFAPRGLPLRAAAYRYEGVRVWGATAITLGMLAVALES